MPGPHSSSFKPTYSGAPTLDWVPSTRVYPPPEVPAAPERPAPPAAMPPRAPAPSVRDELLQSASRFQARYRLKFRAPAAPKAATVPVASPPARAPQVRELAMPAAIAARRTQQPSEIPLMAPIGTSVSLDSPPPSPEAPAPEPPDPHAAAEPEVPVTAAPAAEPEPAEAPPVVEAELAVEPLPTEEAPAEEEPATELSSVVPSASAEPPPRREVSWQVLLLAGPGGSGKSSVAQQLALVLPKTALVKVESLRGAGFSTVVAQTLPHDGVTPTGSGPLPAIWTGASPEARENAAEMVRDYSAKGVLVVVEDTIETAADLNVYLEALAELNVKAATLMPGLEEMERRDKMLPAAQQAGIRVAENRLNVIRQLKDASLVLDTSEETVESTAERIIDLLS